MNLRVLWRKGDQLLNGDLTIQERIGTRQRDTVPDFVFFPVRFVIDRSDVVGARRKYDERVVKRLGRQRKGGWFEFGLLGWRRGLARCGRFRGFFRFRLPGLGRFPWL